MLLHSVAAILLVHALSAGAEMPPSLWRWPGSSSSILSTGPPSSSVNAEFNGMSACRGEGGPNVSFACPHLMLLSPDMLMAAKMDGNDWAVYGVVGIGQTSDCGRCFQLQITSSDSGSMPSVTRYIVQAVNTGSDVSSGQFDIFLGAGGFGLFTACSSDCQSGRVCDGGNCNVPMFSGGFSSWTPDGNCYGGGVRDADGCDALVTTPESSRNFAEKTLIYGCRTAIEQLYHQNFQVNFERVQCPSSLVRVTGIRIDSEDSLPPPSRTLGLQRRGHATTTMDCCKPTCAWRQNVDGFTDSNFPQVYVCNMEGIPLINGLLVSNGTTTEGTSTEGTSTSGVCTKVSSPQTIVIVLSVLSFFMIAVLA
jgi:hypothetical protein